MENGKLTLSFEKPFHFPIVETISYVVVIDF